MQYDGLTVSKGKDGSVAIDGVTLNEQQKAGIQAAEMLAKMGVNIHVFQSRTDANGKPIGEHGSYHLRDGSIHIDLNAGNLGQGVMAYTIAHEFTHFMEQQSPAKFQAFTDALFAELDVDVEAEIERKAEELKRQQPEQYKNASRETLLTDARSEVVAEACETMLTDTDAAQRIGQSLKSKDATLVEKVKQWFRDLATKLREAYKDLHPDSEIAQYAKKTIQQVDGLVQMWVDMAVDAAENYRSADGLTGPANYTADNGKKMQPRSNGSLDAAEILAIQSIGRKSINDFTTSDIQKTEAFAMRYWQEMGAKSPFFRAWFGDWRENDATPVRLANKPGSTRGLHYNQDTGWNINISGKVFDENKSHNSIANREARSYIPYLDSIVENAILLDSSSSNPKSVNSLLMHSLYAVADIGNGPEVLKLYVEEMNNPNSRNTSKRAYNLQNIEKAFNAGKRVQGKTSSPSASASNAINNVADLFASVKSMDANFNPKPVSKTVNADGTPKILYHQTPSDFTIFDTRHEGAGTRDSDTPFGIFLKSSDKDIGLKGGKQMALYARIANPLVVQNREELISRLRTISNDYSQAADELRDLNADYSKKIEDAKEAWNNYMAEWRKEHPGASRKALYDDERFNQLFDAEDELIDEWESEARKIETRCKEAITRDLEAKGYDGVIIKQDKGSFGRTTDAYIALHPEQVKSATDNIGTFDKNNPDIRYSQRQQDQQAALEKQNNKLREDVERMRELLRLQGKTTGGKLFKPESIKTSANFIMRETGRSLDADGKAEFAGILTKAYTALSDENVTYDDIIRECTNVAEWLDENGETQDALDEYAGGILSQMKGIPIRLDETQKAEVSFNLTVYTILFHYVRMPPLCKTVIFRETLNKSSAADRRIFSSVRSAQKWEIHPVFLRF